jgi:hypothetical protein
MIFSFSHRSLYSSLATDSVALGEAVVGSTTGSFALASTMVTQNGRSP